MLSISRLKIAGAITLFFSLESVLFADVLPGPAIPQQVGQSITEIQQQNRPEKQPAPALRTPAEQPSPLGEEAKKITFQLNGIILEGNRIYPTRVLRLLYQHQLKKTITVAQLFDIVQSITNFYRNNGYILSRAILPPQHVKNGIVRIQIIEGTIGKVTISGHPRGTRCLITAYANHIKASGPLKIQEMEKYLLIANETPGTEVKAVLSPSKTEQGAADLNLETEMSRVNGYVSYDNYGTQYIGPQQMTANASVNSMIASGDALQATYVKTPRGAELTYYDVNYNLPIRDYGTRLIFGGTITQTHPLFTLTSSDIDGISENYYVNLQYPMIRSRSEYFTIQGSFNFLDSDVTTLGERLYIDHVRTIGVAAIYQKADQRRGVNYINAGVYQGLPILGYSYNTSQTALTSRPGGAAKYTKVTIFVSRLQAVRGPMSFYGAINSQYGFQPLLAGEQFAYGGSQIGRGYDPAELLGDRGLSGTLEVRFDFPIEKFYIKTLQPYVFYDAGVIWNIIGNDTTPKRASGTSTGFGARFTMTKSISGNVMLAQPLTRKVATEELIGDGTNTRGYFSIVANLD